MGNPESGVEVTDLLQRLKTSPDPDAFSRRVERAKEIRRTYKFGLLRNERDRLVYRVTGGTTPYEVTLDLSGDGGHTCTCPDHSGEPGLARLHAGGFCKHVIAAAIQAGRSELLIPGVVTT